MIRPLRVLMLIGLLAAGCTQPAKYKTYVPSSPPVSYEPSVSLTDGEDQAERKIPPIPKRRPQYAAVVEEAEDQPKIDWLLGRDFEAVQALLGDPALKEVQAPANVWAYNGSGCVLNIFFYPHVGGSGYQALTYEVRPGQPDVEAETRCFSELLQDKEKAESN